MSLVLHSKEFVQQWRKLLENLYGYPIENGALLVRGVFGGRTSVYLPLLNYSDLSVADALKKAKECGDRNFQIRVLDEQCDTFEPDDTVTMRMDIAGKTADMLFKKTMSSKCRNHIRKSEKSGLTLQEGATGSVVDDFYEIFSTTMYRHGTPVFTKKLFTLLPQFVSAKFLVAYLDDKPIAGLCLVFDGKLAWVPWAGSLTEHRVLCPNQFLYWNAIQRAVDAGLQVFDFGRSGFKAPTYIFKAEWGALPVKVRILSSQDQDVYQKYSAAAAIWKKLPRSIVDFVGPILCRYLPDL